MTKDPMHPEELSKQSLSNLLKAAPAIRNPAAVQVTALLHVTARFPPVMRADPSVVADQVLAG
jgi:hypothetical protein